jgi:hypothetical protein
MRKNMMLRLHVSSPLFTETGKADTTPTAGAYVLRWGETESIWYVDHYLAYCTSPG